MKCHFWGLLHILYKHILSGSQHIDSDMKENGKNSLRKLCLQIMALISLFSVANKTR
jgi:hypothetical protein